MPIEVKKNILIKKFNNNKHNLDKLRPQLNLKNQLI
jgi:hypothetical protein